jgi:hypothetical protein
MTETAQKVTTMETVPNNEVFVCLNRHLVGSVLICTINMTDADRENFYSLLGCEIDKTHNQVIVGIQAFGDLTLEQVEELTVKQIAQAVNTVGYSPALKLCYSHDTDLVEALNDGTCDE